MYERHVPGQFDHVSLRNIAHFALRHPLNTGPVYCKFCMLAPHHQPKLVMPGDMKGPGCSRVILTRLIVHN
jgi:hypothetical protein